MNILNNPFVVYGYKGAKYFCDRKKETEWITKTLDNERNITLVAPRRMGKTGLIHHVFDNIKQANRSIKCFYIDIFATKNLHQMVQLFAQSIIGQLDKPTQSVMRKIQTFFGNCRPTITFDPVSGLPSVTLDINNSESEETLKSIFDYMRQSGKRCYVAIDEFQQILSYPEKGVEALLRSYIQFLPNVYFIFSGSIQHLISEMFLSSKHPFYQSTQFLSLDCIDRDAYRDFANSFFAGQEREITEETFTYLYNKVNGITWYVQTILSHLYERSELDLTRENIDNCLAEIIEEQGSIYQSYCSWLTENQLLLLIAVAKNGSVGKPFANDFVRKYNLPSTSSIKTALSALIDKQLITCILGKYSVTDIFFSLWLKRRYM